MRVRCCMCNVPLGEAPCSAKYIICFKCDNDPATRKAYDEIVASEGANTHD